MPSQRFTKGRRLRRHGDFKRVFERALRVQGRYFTVLMAPNVGGGARLGIVASRKLGDAVRRNRAKRLIREVFRRFQLLPCPGGFDVVVIPRRELFDAVYSNLETDFRSTLKRCAARLPVNATR